jgi:hypothetical protein
VNRRSWALVAGASGIAANLTLVLFFALAQPWRWPDSPLRWLGPANDALVVVQFLTLVPVALAVRARLGRLAGLTAAAVTAMATVAVLQVLLLAGVLDFDLQGWLVTACFPVIFGWLLVLSRFGVTVRFGRRVGAGFLVGISVAALCLPLPWGSPAQFAGFALALLVGGPAWLAFPVWPLLVLTEEGI